MPQRSDRSDKDDGEVFVGEALPLFDLAPSPELAELSKLEVVTEPEITLAPKRRGRPPGSKNKPKGLVPPPKPGPPPPRIDETTPPFIATALANSEELPPQLAPLPVPAEPPTPTLEHEPQQEEPSMSPVIAPKPFDGIPFDQIRELTGNYGKVHVRLSRKDARGKYAVMGSHEMTPAELSDIESFLEEFGGGGEYEILVRSPADRTQVLLRFAFKLEGPPKPYAEIIAQAMSNQQSGPRGVLPLGAGVPPAIGTDEWAEHAGASVGGVRFTSAPFADPYGRRPASTSPNGTLRDRPAPGATMSSDELAYSMLQRLEAQHVELQRSYQALARQKAEDDKKAEREAAALREKNREEAFQRQLDMVRLELKAQAGGGARGMDLGGVAAIVAAVAPIVTSLMNANANAATQAAQLQTQGMKTLMDATLAQANKPSEVEKLIGIVQTFGPMVLPLAKEFLARKDDPEAQVKLITAMAEGQLNQISMAAQLIEQFASDRIPAEHPAIPIIKQLIEGGMQTAQAYFAEKSGGAAALPPGMVPAGAIEAGEEPEEPPALPPRPRAAPPAPAQAPAPRPAAAPAPQPAANGAAAHPMFKFLPPAFKTPQWIKLLEAVHQEPPPPADSMGEMLGFHLMHCMVFGNLPAELEALPAQPIETLTKMFSFLPINLTAPDYVKAVVEKAVAFLVSSNQIQAPAPVPPPKSAPAPKAAPTPAKARPMPPVVEDPSDDEEEDVEESGETELDENADSDEETAAQS